MGLFLCAVSIIFFLFCLIPTICLWLGLFDLICAWKTDESRRQQQGAAAESCSKGEWFLMPRQHSYLPHDGSPLRESYSRARILSKKIQWIAVSCHRPRCISFRLRENPLESVIVDEACCLFIEKQHKGRSRPSSSIPRKWWAALRYLNTHLMRNIVKVFFGVFLMHGSNLASEVSVYFYSAAVRKSLHEVAKPPYPCLILVPYFLAHFGGKLCTVTVFTNAIPDREQI